MSTTRAFLGPHWYIEYPMKEKEKLRMDLRTEKATISAFYVAVENQSVQHAGVGCAGKHALQNHKYVILEEGM